MPTIAQRLAALDWDAIAAELDARGLATTPPVLTPGECAALAALYDEPARFRSTVDMARHRFGAGTYKYFARPLPAVVEALRVHAYPHLARVANEWAARLGSATRYPATLDAFLAQCAEAGQPKPTPLLLRYEAGGYNCLHRDLYGDVFFPIQMLGFLDRPGVDYGGGEFLIVEQRPRAQSAAEVAAGAQGAFAFFTTQVRPVTGTRGTYRVQVRHGVSRVHWGVRRTLGVIFHDAR
ncbi:MAG: 2OG-Fe(II) oxygenase [Gemmatimonadetes bacterium]|nr:2OG-Fe(II) oxygenase [Gemmatimonadota bacterium]